MLYILLVVIIVMLCTPADKRTSVLYSAAKAIIYGSVIVGAIVLLICIGVFHWKIALLMVGVVILIFIFLQDAGDNKRIRQGDPVATEARILTLMGPPFKYTRAQAEDAIMRLKGKP